MRYAAWVGFAVLAAGLAGLTLLGYLLPAEAKSAWWLNNPAADHFRAMVPGADRLPVMSVEGWRLGFRFALVAAWVGYGGVVVAAYRAVLPRGMTAALAGAAVAVGVGFPPVLSSDVYCYALDGHTAVVHGRNPYSVAPSDPHPRDDAAARFATRDTAPPYGPVWVGLCVGFAAVLGPLGLGAEIIGLKLVQAVSLIGAGWAAGGIAGRFAPGRGGLGFAALVGNPLLLVEGPGNGHNDLTMMGLFLAGTGLILGRRWAAGSAVLGLAAGVKFLPLAVLPWLMIAAYRAAGWRTAAVVPVAFLAPPVACYLPFADGARLGEAFGGQAANARSSEVREREAERRAALESAGVPPALAAVGVVLRRNLVLLAVYAAATAFVLRSRRPAAWLEAWVAVAAGMAMLLTGLAYPWYFAWPLVPALTAACRFRLAAAGGCSLIGFVQTWRYAAEW